MFLIYLSTIEGNAYIYIYIYTSMCIYEIARIFVSICIVLFKANDRVGEKTGRCNVIK